MSLQGLVLSESREQLLILLRSISYAVIKTPIDLKQLAHECDVALKTSIFWIDSWAQETPSLDYDLKS